MTTRFGVFCIIAAQLAWFLLYVALTSPPLLHRLGHLTGLVP